MSEGAKERRLAKRAAKRAMSAAEKQAARVKGCIRCGRGEINVSLLPPPLNSPQAAALVRLTLIPCTDPDQHIPPRGKHIGLCSGWVYAHERPRICQAVLAAGRRAQLVTAGAN